jgi:hypothetical protein
MKSWSELQEDVCTMFLPNSSYALRLPRQVFSSLIALEPMIEVPGEVNHFSVQERLVGQRDVELCS